MAAVRERHVPDPQLVVEPEHGQVGVDHVAALQSDQHGHLVLGVSVSDVYRVCLKFGHSEKCQLLFNACTYNHRILDPTSSGLDTTSQKI